MAKLSTDLISKFAKVVNDVKKNHNKETNMYGTAVVIDENGTKTVSVQLDGSEILTPALSTSDVNDGDRVTVLIKNHTATITGNFTAPSASVGAVSEIGANVNNVKDSVAELNDNIQNELSNTNSRIDDANTQIKEQMQTLGQAGLSYEVTVDDTGMNVSIGDTIYASINNDGITNVNATIKDELRIVADNVPSDKFPGFFIWGTHGAGNLGLIWRTGEINGG